LDPMKPGRYFYDKYNFEYEPFYVGKGTGKRIVEHLKKSKLENTFKNNKFKINKIKKILRAGKKIIMLKIVQNVTDSYAKDKEKELIKKIGRRNLKLGPLTNMTDGGEGNFGLILSEDSKIRISNSVKRFYKNHPEVGDKHSEFMKMNNPSKREDVKDKYRKRKNPMEGKKHTEDTKKLLSIMKKGKKLSISRREQIALQTHGKNNPNSKYIWHITYLGIIEEVYDMVLYCERNNLCAPSVYSMISKAKDNCINYKNRMIERTIYKEEAVNENS
jgi:hypothetical protein